MLGNWHQLWEIVSAPDNVPIVALLFLIPFYIWYAFRQAFANDELIAKLEADPAAAKTAHRKTQPYQPKWEREVHTWPYLMRVEFVAAILVTVLLMVWSLTLSAPLEEPSNPNVTMNPAKAPWYFLGLAGDAGLFRSLDGRRGHAHADHRRLDGHTLYRRESFGQWLLHLQAAQIRHLDVSASAFIGLWVVMIIIGTFIRGPGWMWFWPTQTWDAQAVQFAVNRNLDQIFSMNGSWLAHVMPAANRDYAPILGANYFRDIPDRVCISSWASYAVYLVMNSTAFARKIFQPDDAVADRDDGYFPGSDAQPAREDSSPG